MTQQNKWSAEELMERKDVLHIHVPLTPSLNETKRWDRSRAFSRIKLHRIEQEKAVMACLCQQRVALLFKGGFPWAMKVIIHVVRCSNTYKLLDESNLIGGLKATEDALVSMNVIPDDSPAHVSWGFIQQRLPPARNGLRGPATHLFVERSK